MSESGLQHTQGDTNRTATTPAPQSRDNRGKISSLSGRTLKGWFFNPEEPETKPEVEIIVDGQIVAVTRADRARGHLVRAGAGDGHHGFTATLPDHLFDGSSRDVEVRLKGERRTFRNALSGVKFLPIDPASLDYAITEIGDGYVSGYCLDTTNPNTIVELEVANGENPLAAIRADAESPAPEAGPAGHGFRINLSAIKDDLLTSDIYLRLAGSDIILSLDGKLGHLASAVIVEEVTASSIRGRVEVPGTPTPDHFLHLLLDGDIIDILFPAPPSQGAVYPFLIDLTDRDVASEVELKVIDPQSDDHYVGAPYKVHIPQNACLLANPHFLQWSPDGTPWGWEAPVAVSASPIPADTPEGVGVFFDLSELTPGALHPLLRQSFRLNTLHQRDRRLDLVVSHWASAPCKLRIVLSFNLADGPSTVTADISATPRWQSRVVRMVLPAAPADLGGVGEITVGAIMSPGCAVRIGQVALGPRGFNATPDVATVANTPVERPYNAVQSPEFERWDGPLRRTATAKRLPCGEGWELALKAPNPGLQVFLDTIDIRDPTIGLESRRAYGISLVGQSNSAWTRLECSLNASDVQHSPPNSLDFYAKSATGCEITRVFVLRRHVSDITDPGADIPKDVTLAVLEKRIPVGSVGSMFHIELNAAVGIACRDAAREMFYDPLQQLILVFDFAHDIDITLAAVRFGLVLDHSGEAASQRYLRLEDDKIYRQCHLIRSLEGWASEAAAVTPIADQTGRHTSKAVAPTPDDRVGPSIEIVVCVYNAPIEVEACLNSIVRCRELGYKLTIIDDGSALPTARMLARFAEAHEWIRLLRNPVNLGYTKSANRGVASAEAEFCILLNSDTIVTTGWASGLVRCAQSDETIAFVGPLSNAASWQSIPDVVSESGAWKVNLLPVGFTPDDMARLVAACANRDYPDVPLLNGFCTLMRSRVLQEVGYLDEGSFPLGYGEENDLCLRVRGLGYKLALADDIYVYHSKSASFGATRRKALAAEGSSALKRKHPDFDAQAVRTQFTELAPIVGLRARVREQLKALKFGPDGLPLTGARAQNV